MERGVLGLICGERYECVSQRSILVQSKGGGIEGGSGVWARFVEGVWLLVQQGGRV